MKILVLGGNGMVGHYLLSGLQKRHDVKATFKQPWPSYTNLKGLDAKDTFIGCDVRHFQHVEKIMQEFIPDAVINAIGVTKQLVDKRGLEDTIDINALFPHRLANLCETHVSRLIQLSSDCIFSGAKGAYTEDDISDAKDVYGCTKFLGEVDADHVVTLRKSTIGLELTGAHGLVEWFLSQTGEIKGFNNAIYSGLITEELVRVIELILLDIPSMSGIWNVAGPPISKYHLLTQLQEEIQKNDVVITRDETFFCDRSLDGSRFERETGYTPPDWSKMIQTLGHEIRLRNNT
jgi:dTDP-4-dehydrorhamnose reductase